MQDSSCVCNSVMFCRRKIIFPLMSTSDSPANAHTCKTRYANSLYQFYEPAIYNAQVYKTGRTSSLNQLRQWQRERHMLCFFTSGRSSNTSLFRRSAQHTTTGAPGVQSVERQEFSREGTYRGQRSLAHPAERPLPPECHSASAR